MNEHLPDSKSSLLLRYDNILFKDAVNISPESNLFSVGRMLLGELRNRLSLGGIEVGAQKLILQNGDQIIAIVGHGINKIILLEKPPQIPIQISEILPFFLVYPCSPSMPFGYGIDEKGNKKVRTIPYFIDEPVFISYPILQFACIGKVFYQYQLPNQYTTKHPYYYPYGNQYTYDLGGNIWTWWHSGYGDLPHLRERLYTNALRFEQSYMPILCTEEAIPYIYFLQNVSAPVPVDVRIYRNGIESIIPPGEVGKFMVAGVGVRENGDVIYVKSAFSVYTFYVYKNGISTQIGVPWVSDSYVERTIIFNQDATEAAFLVELIPPEWKELTVPPTTLHKIELSFSVDRDGNYSWSEKSRKAYYQQYSKSTSAKDIIESDSYDDELAWEYIHSGSYSYNYVESGMKEEYDAELIPIALYYDKGIELKSINMKFHQDQSESTDSGIKSEGKLDRLHLDSNPYYFNEEGYSHYKNGVWSSFNFNQNATIYFYDKSIQLAIITGARSYSSYNGYAADYNTKMVVVYKNGDVCYTAPDGTEYRCDNYGIKDYYRKDTNSITHGDVSESRIGHIGFLRFVNAKQQFMVIHRLDINQACNGYDSRILETVNIQHSEFIPPSVSWNNTSSTEVSTSYATGKPYDSIVETSRTSHRINTISGERIFADHEILNGSHNPIASSSPDPSIVITPQYYPVTEYSIDSGDSSIIPAPDIRAWIDNPYFLATLSYRVDPSLQTDNGSIYSVITLGDNGLIDKRKVEKLIYMGNEYGTLVSPGPSALIGKPGYEVFDKILFAPIVTSFNNEETVGQLYPIGWGFEWRGNQE